jgi:histidyl-tRNA synthetase
MATYTKSFRVEVNKWDKLEQLISLVGLKDQTDLIIEALEEYYFMKTGHLVDDMLDCDPAEAEWNV